MAHPENNLIGKYNERLLVCTVENDESKGKREEAKGK